MDSVHLRCGAGLPGQQCERRERRRGSRCARGQKKRKKKTEKKKKDFSSTQLLAGLWFAGLLSGFGPNIMALFRVGPSLGPIVHLGYRVGTEPYHFWTH